MDGQTEKAVTLAIVGAPPDEKYGKIVLDWLQENKPNGRLDFIAVDNGEMTVTDLVYLELLWNRDFECGVQYIRGCKDAQHTRDKMDDKADYIIFFLRDDDQFCRQWIGKRQQEGKHGKVFRVA